MDYIQQVKKHGGIRPAARALGINESSLRRKIESQERQTTKPGDAKKVKKLAEFKSLYDKDTIVPAKIKEGLKALGADGWEYESQFAKDCCVSLADIGTYRDLFADHIVPLRREGKRVWAGSRKLAEQMRSMV
jgi:hypothetical protein